MNHLILQRLINLGISLFVTWHVWRYYRDLNCPMADRYLTFFPRFWVGSVDSCVLWPVGFVTTILLTFNLPKGVVALLLIMESLAWLFYTVVMHARYGQTVGKMVCKVRVVDYRTEGNITYLQACLREGIPAIVTFVFLGYELIGILNGNVSSKALENGQIDIGKTFWILTALPVLWFLAEVLTMLTNSKRRALHDFIAGTVVIRLNVQEEGIQPATGPELGPLQAPQQNQ